MELPDFKSQKKQYLCGNINKASPSSFKNYDKTLDQPVTVTRKRGPVLHEKLNASNLDMKIRRTKTASLVGKQHDSSVALQESTEIVSSSIVDAPAHRPDFSIT